MKGIDIYHGDSLCEGKQLKAFCEAAYKASDFVIVKSTQGVSSYKYVNWFHIMMKRCFKDGKLTGAYHYAAGNDPVKEADYFLSVVKPYLGKIILCLDWEGKQNSAFGSKTWCTKFIDRVMEKTGLTCILYTGSDGCTQNKSLAGKVPLWFAGYPKPQSMTWDVPKWKYNLGSWGSYPDIWQYTSSNEKCDRNTTKHDKKWWMNLTKTSQEKEDILRKQVVNNLVMLSGIKEGSKEHKMIIDTFNKSGLCPRYKMTTKDSWCATAVSYAFIVSKLAGKPGSGSVCEFVECSCQEMIKKAKAQGVWKESDSYVPKPADVIMYDWQDTGKGDDTGWADHVGIVVSCTDRKNIKVIEGNKNDAVGYRSVPVNGKTIRGFIAPKYGTGKEEKSVPKEEKTVPKEEKTVPKPGSRVIFSVSKKTSPNTKPVTQCVVTASELNVRVWAGSENKTCSFSPLKKGTKVSICDSILSAGGTAWDYVKVGGKYGFVSSKYIK